MAHLNDALYDQSNLPEASPHSPTITFLKCLDFKRPFEKVAKARFLLQKTEQQY